MSMRTASALAAAVLVAVVAVALALAYGGSDRPHSRLRTVFIGDSITWADSTSPGTRPGPGSWVRYAVEDPRSPWELAANVAVSGQTLGQMDARFQRDVLARHPEAVVIMGGTNDLLTGAPRGLGELALRHMVDDAHAAGVPVWIIGLPPIDQASPSSLATMATMEQAVARATGATYVPVGEGLATPTGDWRRGLSFDGVHPTPAGARALADAVLARLG